MKQATWILLLLLVLAPLAQALERPDDQAFIDFGRDRIIIKIDLPPDQLTPRLHAKSAATVGVASLDGIAAKHGVTVIEPMFPGAEIKEYQGEIIDLTRYYIVRFSEGVNLDEILNAYKADANISYAVADEIYRPDGVPNDTYYPNSWHYYQASDHDIDGPEAWDVETGNPSIIVAIIDTGVKYWHPDLGGLNAVYADPLSIHGNIWINEAERNGVTGVDDDGNGWVDDWVGWDYVDSDNDPAPISSDHGTGVAGIVGAMTNNGIGVAGIAGGWHNGSQEVYGNGVRIMSMRAGTSGGIWNSASAQAIFYAAQNGAHIMNWSRHNPDGSVIASMKYFMACGGLVFKAAGNSGTTADDAADTRYDIVSVAATDENDGRAIFSPFQSSNYGGFVEICAPGVGIWTTTADGGTPWAAGSGTSYASPLTAGVAALIWSQHPDWNAEQVRGKLLNSTDNIDAFLDPADIGQMGRGRLNAFKALQDDNCDNEPWFVRAGNGDEQKAFGVCENPAGDFAIAGFEDTGSPTNVQECYVAMFDECGVFQWGNTYGEPTYRETGYGVAPRVGGGFVVTGESWLNSTQSYVYYLEVDTLGQQLTQQRLGGSGSAAAYSMATAPDGGHVVAGFTNASGLDKDIYIFKTIPGTGGTIDWSRTIDIAGLDDMARDIEATQDGGYIVTGSAEQAGGYADAFLLKLDSAGTTEWTEYYPGQDDDVYGKVVHELPHGGYTFLYSTESMLAGEYRTVIYRVDPDGDITSEQDMATDTTRWVFESFNVTEDGGVVFMFSSINTMTGATSISISKYSPLNEFVGYQLPGFSDYADNRGAVLETASDGRFMGAGFYDIDFTYGSHTITEIDAGLFLTDQFPDLTEVIANVPEDYPTIQAALNDAFNGWIIEVDPGTYTGADNRDLDFKGKEITLRSLNGPAETIIDCEGSGRAFLIDTGDNPVTIEGFTVINGLVTGNGGALLATAGQVTVNECLFTGHGASASGGAIYASVSLSCTACTFYDNEALTGGTIYGSATADIDLDKCIVANTVSGDGIVTESGAAFDVTCCDFWANAGSHITGAYGNGDVDAYTLFANPLFCDPDSSIFTIVDASPCAAANNDCAELIGAFGVDCTPFSLASIYPPPNQVNELRTRELLAIFADTLDAASATASNFSVYSRSFGYIPGNVTLFAPLFWFYFTPTANYDYGDEITLLLHDGIRGANCGPFADRYQGRFVVETSDSSFGTFTSPVQYTAGDKPKSLFLADIDGDGDKDMAAANHDGNTVSVFFSNGDGTFGSPTSYATGTNPWDVTLVDLDRDGDMDMAVSNYATDNVAVFFNDGTGLFGTPAYYTVGTRPHPIMATDLDSDGDFDLVTANLFSHDVSILFNYGDGTFAPQVTHTVGEGPIGLASADYDEDGDFDIFVASYYDDVVSILINDSHGDFAPYTALSNGADGPFNVIAVDLDNDDDVDIVTANRLSNNISVLLQTAPGTFASAVTYAAGIDPYYSAAADIDGDGYSDIIAANLNSDDISVYINQTDGSFSAQTRYAAGDGPFWVFATDCNDDGRIDLAVANAFSDNISLYFNADVAIGPQLVSPVNGSSTYSHSILFDWLPYAEADTYEIVVDDDPYFGSVDRTMTGLTATQWLVSPTLPHGTWYWKVRGHIAGGALPWSGIWFFMIVDEPDPSCPVLFTHNGEEYVMENPLLTACEESGYVDIVTDYYQLARPPATDGNRVTMQLRELEDEISYVYDLELLVVDHSPDSRITCSPDGDITAFSEVIRPIRAIDNLGIDCLSLLAEEEGDLYAATDQGWIEMTFPAQAITGSEAGIMLGIPPKKLCPIIKKTIVDDGADRPVDDAIDWGSDFTVEYRTDRDEWIPLADIPTRSVTTSTVAMMPDAPARDRDLTVRVSWQGAYAADQVGLVFAVPEPVEVNRIALGNETVFTAEGTESTGDAARPVPRPVTLQKGDVYEFSFDLPDADEQSARDYILKAVGRYQPDYDVFTHLRKDKPELHGNFPNPFNPGTTISYSLPSATDVRVDVYNVLGQRVANLVDDNQSAGSYEVYWDGRDADGRTVASGVYFYRLTTDKVTQSRKMLLMK